MKDRTLNLIWLYLYILCAALGFIPEPQGLLQAMLALAAICFFIPPSVLIYRGVRHHAPKHLRRVQSLSILSLALTTVLYVANILSVAASDLMGSILNAALTVLAAPALTFPIPIVPIFGWACLLVTCLKYRKSA